jgi:hypothetical protein
VNPAVAALRRGSTDFAGISLRGLEERAPLQTRADNKYLVPVDELEVLLGVLTAGHAALDIAGTRVFGYRSTYLDSPDLALYRAHLQGRRRRYKVRIRHYRETGGRFLEVKSRGRRGETVKSRMAYHGPDRLTDEARDFLEQTLRAAYGRWAAPPLGAVLTTAYERVTLVRAEGAERVTIDAGLVVSAGDRSVAMRADLALVETKTRRGHGVADRALRGLGRRPLEGASKYCVGIATLGAGVPSNPFRPMLRDCFARAQPPGRSREAATPRR